LIKKLLNIQEDIMTESVCITHPQKLNVQIIGERTSGKYKVESGQIKHWESSTYKKSTLCSILMDLGGHKNFNCIELKKYKNNLKQFPNHFSFEISDDGHIWESILHEIDFKETINTRGIWNFSLVRARYIRLVCFANAVDKNNSYQVVTGPISVSISGVEKIDVSSELDRLWVKENLFDRRAEYGWSSAPGTKNSEEFFLIDLGSVHRVVELRILTKNRENPLFPENFVMLGSEDDISWHTILEETSFMAQGGNWYRWRIPPTNLRYIKFISRLGAKLEAGRYICQLIEFELFAYPEILGEKISPKLESIPYASVLRSGLIRLARDGEMNSGVAVQGSDRRLKDASTEQKGIVELAADGEDIDGVAVQGNDKRLKKGSLESYGIVRLCPNGDYKKNRVVMGQDRRLQPASVGKKGIVELAKDEDTRPETVIQANDSRLKDATEKSKGITILAKDGESHPGKVLQSNDMRIKDANTENMGILRFAKNGESEAFTAVQGNDNRLKPATTVAKGIVELAEDGEVKEKRAVQSNDSRLKTASTSDPGIIKLCPEGKKDEDGVVTGNDPRLFNARKPLEHSHDYAPTHHSFNSHKGRLVIKENTNLIENGVIKPSLESGTVYFENQGTNSAVTAVGKETGIRSFADDTGIFSSGKKSGLFAASINGPGLQTVSQKDYAIKIQKKNYLEKKIYSSGLAIKAEGQSDFTGTVTIHSDIKKTDSSSVVRQGATDYFAVYFMPDGKDFLEEGDCLIITGQKAGRPCLGRCRAEGDRRFVGILVKDSPLIIGDREEGDILVAICGIVMAKVDASKEEVVPGDLLVLSQKEAHMQKYNAKMHNSSSICAKAMARLTSGSGMIPILIRGF
jgi:hypothetical protein